MLFAVLLLFALLFSIGNISAADNGNVNISTNNTNLNESTNQTNNSSSSESEVGIIKSASDQTTVNSTNFTRDEIKSAASRVRAYVEMYYTLPNYVQIGSTQVSMPQFLELLTTTLLQINAGNTNPVTLKSFIDPANPQDDIRIGNIYKSEYLKIASDVKSYMDSTGKTPDYAYGTSLGAHLGFQNLVYMYTMILQYYNASGRVADWATMRPWAAISKFRPVYVTSDNIINTSTDTARINAIVNGLKALGLNALNWGLGPNTHYSVLQSAQVPANALVVDIYGGACAGTIYEMGLSYYKNLVGTRKVFNVWIPPSVDITGLAWLPRAHDDNFSPANFTGLANPDQYLLNNGYHYMYSSDFNRDLNSIISHIYNEAKIA